MVDSVAVGDSYRLVSIKHKPSSHSYNMLNRSIQDKGDNSVYMRMLNDRFPLGGFPVQNIINMQVSFKNSENS